MKAGPLFSLRDQAGSFDAPPEVELALLQKLLNPGELAEFLLRYPTYDRQAQTQSYRRLSAFTRQKHQQYSNIRHILEYRGEKGSATYGTLQVLDAFRDIMRHPAEEEVAQLRSRPLDHIFETAVA